VIVGELLLWWCLQDTGTDYPQPGTDWAVRNAPAWVRQEMLDAAERRSLYFPETELTYPEQDSYFSGVVYMMYRRRIGNAYPYPVDPRGPMIP
jgi:hypothetical protein